MLDKNMCPLIELKGITKIFPGVKALDDMRFDIYPGEVHALVGENGAGKSTLIKVITGVHRPDSGEIYWMGQKQQDFFSTGKAIQTGIACIYQELSIVPQLDIAKNLFVGNMPTIGKSHFIDQKKLYEDAQKVLDRIGMNISPKHIAGELSIAQQQMIEIGRAISRNAKLIIMDEPTSSLSDNEISVLFKLIHSLTEQGIAIVYVSHKLDEVLSLSDRVTVMRDGKYILTSKASELDKPTLIRSMLGRRLDNMYVKRTNEIGEPRLQVEHLTSEGKFEDISFDAQAGEIVGFFGLVGAGRTEIMRAVFGVDGYDSGKVTICGKSLRKRSPHTAIRYGMGFATEDRKSEGLMLQLDILTNITAVRLSKLASLGVLNERKSREFAVKYSNAMKIKTPTLMQLANNLSGGNQQKVVLGKWMMNDPAVLILDEPTRGIDVGSKAEIYALISDMAAAGVAIVIVSSEIEEILGVCDRVNVISTGKLIGCYDVKNTNSEEILTAAFGGVSK